MPEPNNGWREHIQFVQNLFSVGTEEGFTLAGLFYVFNEVFEKPSAIFSMFYIWNFPFL